MATAAAAAARRARAIMRISEGAQRSAELFGIEIPPPIPSKDPEANTSARLEHAADVIEAINATREAGPGEGEIATDPPPAPAPEEAPEAAPAPAPRRQKVII